MAMPSLERPISQLVTAEQIRSPEFNRWQWLSNFCCLRGASLFKMMDVSRHRSVDTLRAYVRDAELFRDHAGAGLR